MGRFSNPFFKRDVGDNKSYCLMPLPYVYRKRNLYMNEQRTRAMVWVGGTWVYETPVIIKSIV